MSTTPPTLSSETGHRYRLQVNAYDRVSSLLVALLVLMAATVSALVVVFLFRQFSPEVGREQTTTFGPPVTAELPNGYAEDIEPAGAEDAPEDLPPQLQETLQQLTQAVYSKTAVLAADIPSGDTTAGRGPKVGNKHPTGSDHIGPMPIQELRYDPKSDLDYAQMIDFFGGELAVLDRRANKLYYAEDLSNQSPTIREGTPEEENKANRYRLLSSGELRKLEQRLATKLGIMHRDAIILVFFPEETANQFFREEAAAMRKNGYEKLEDVERTVFRVTRKGDKFEIAVEEQTYF
ncbi:hypothetical protein [Aeoliella sp.]|uniref:hypothetical protein n=1 Tax=Aeoliella sp. TaxID=2795800 RepID=UPI003CCB8E29